MAQAALVAEISTKGAKRSQRELEAVGKTAKKTESNVIQMGDAFTKTGKQASLAASAITGPLGGVASRITAVTSLLTSGAGAATTFGLAVTALGFSLAEGIQELDRMNIELAKTEAILKATGQASGKTAKQLQEQAQAIAMATLASTQGIQQAQAKLLTFDKIQGQVFNDAISLTQDLAAVFGGDAASQATQLGKALQDPVKGLTALNRVGVSFTEQQADQVKAMVKAGDTMKAQAVIITALKNQVGGAGEAVAKDSLAGKLDTAGQLWSEFSAKLAESTGTMTLTERLLDGLVGRLGELNKALEPESTTDLFQKRLDIMMQIASIEGELEQGGSARSQTRLKERLAGLQKQADSLLKQITGQAEAENAESLKASESYEKSQLKIKQDSLALQTQAEEDARNKQVLADLEFFDKRLAYKKEQEKKINDETRQAYIDDANFYSDILKLKADEDKRAAKAKENERNTQIGALGNLTSDLKTTLGEQSAIYKAAAITEATVNTYRSANAAYAALAGIPIVGPALGGAAAGVAIGAGLTNVRAITSAREQGGSLAPGQSSTIAERGKLEVITPQNATRVQTANQMKSIMGESGGNSVSLTVIDQSGGEKEYTQETKSDGEIVLLIRNTVSNDLATANTQISKSLSNSTTAARRR